VDSLSDFKLRYRRIQTLTKTMMQSKLMTLLSLIDFSIAFDLPPASEQQIKASVNHRLSTFQKITFRFETLSLPRFGVI
jgi:hypothetical protein